MPVKVFTTKYSKLRASPFFIVNLRKKFNNIFLQTQLIFTPLKQIQKYYRQTDSMKNRQTYKPIDIQTH